MNKDEALKMAIDFLDGSYEAHKVRKACQEALEQPAWIGLADYEMDKIWGAIVKHGISGLDFTIRYGRAIEQALKEKNK